LSKWSKAGKLSVAPNSFKIGALMQRFKNGCQ
jgi:hypothetical protein